MYRNLFCIPLALFALLNVACSNSQRDAIGKTEVVIETSKGDITLRLYDDTPLHRDNFIRMAREGVYDNIVWNRIVPQGTIQSGEPSQKAGGSEPTVDTSAYRHTIRAEIHYPRHYHKAGALAMARQPDSINIERRSSGTHFYIVSGKKFSRGSLAELWQGRRDTEPGFKLPALSEQQKKVYTTQGGCPHLDGDYTIFGEVVEGMQVVESICRTPVDQHEHPLKEVIIKTVRVKE